MFLSVYENNYLFQQYLGPGSRLLSLGFRLPGRTLFFRDSPCWRIFLRKTIETLIFYFYKILIINKISIIDILAIIDCFFFIVLGHGNSGSLGNRLIIIRTNGCLRGIWIRLLGGSGHRWGYVSPFHYHPDGRGAFSIHIKKRCRRLRYIKHPVVAELDAVGDGDVYFLIVIQIRYPQCGSRREPRVGGVQFLGSVFIPCRVSLLYVLGKGNSGRKYGKKRKEQKEGAHFFHYYPHYLYCNLL